MSRGYAASRVHYPAGDYRHPPAGLLQLRLVRHGSSYADIDLGQGLRHVFTRPGDLLLSLPNCPTRFRIDDGRDLTLLQVMPELAATVLAESGAVLDDLVTLTERPFRDALIAEICRRLEEFDFVDGSLGFRALTLVIGLLLSCARKQVSHTRRPVLTERGLGDVVRYIDTHIADPITVERLAGIAGMPTRQFSMAFREATALPVYQYVLRRRVEYARDLLSSTGLGFSEVAQKSGFSHQAHMNRVVKRLLGRTPAQIRGRSG
jgi:AraC family transcriptional regulator